MARWIYSSNFTPWTPNSHKAQGSQFKGWGVSDGGESNILNMEQASKASLEISNASGGCGWQGGITSSYDKQAFPKIFLKQQKWSCLPLSRVFPHNMWVISNRLQVLLVLLSFMHITCTHWKELFLHDNRETHNIVAQGQYTGLHKVNRTHAY